MKIKKTIALLFGMSGFTMTFFSLTQGAITGNVIGTNPTSKLLGVFGVILMIVAIAVERYELKKQK
jgi:hypothetical protein